MVDSQLPRTSFQPPEEATGVARPALRTAVPGLGPVLGTMTSLGPALGKLIGVAGLHGAASLRSPIREQLPDRRLEQDHRRLN
jgi:hypothetical protein